MTLSERRKADRIKMAEGIVELTRGYGFRAEMSVNEWDPRCVDVHIDTLHSLRVHIDFDGRSPQPDVFVVPWYTRGRTRLDPRFGFAGCEVNPYHFGKCTCVAYGFDGLVDHLHRQLSMIKDGTAFQPDSIGPDNVKVGAAAHDGTR